ncbi:MAG: hypothetical protein MHM6MM_008805, partial [Cercozoa sp. M6MM]
VTLLRTRIAAEIRAFSVVSTLTLSPVSLDTLPLSMRQNNIEYEKRRRGHFFERMLHEVDSGGFSDHVMTAALSNIGVRTTEKTSAMKFDMSTVMFVHIENHLELTETHTSAHLARALSSLFADWDGIVARNGLSRTDVCDTDYVAAFTSPDSHLAHHEKVLETAFEILSHALEGSGTLFNGAVVLRIGVATGELIAGIESRRQPILRSFGQAVDAAATVAFAGPPNAVYCTNETARRVLSRSALFRFLPFHASIQSKAFAQFKKGRQDEPPATVPAFRVRRLLLRETASLRSCGSPREDWDMAYRGIDDGVLTDTWHASSAVATALSFKAVRLRAENWRRQEQKRRENADEILRAAHTAFLSDRSRTGGRIRLSSHAAI